MREHLFYEYSELIEIIKEKNIHVSNKDAAIESLKNHSYYTLVNGYKNDFLINGETDLLENNTKFNDLVSLYYIDRDISSLILKYIIFVEKSLRSRIGHYVAKYNSENHSQYLNRSYYRDYKNLRRKTLEDIEKTINECPSNSVTHYYKTNKSNIPTWVLVNDVSFYSAISWTMISDETVRHSIIEDYFRETELYDRFQESFFFISFNFLREYRNITAHGKRDFDKNFNNYLNVEYAKHVFGPLLDEEDYPNGKMQDLFAVINLILVYTLDVNVKRKFVNELVVFLVEYVDLQKNKPIKLINGKNIYEILNIPEDILQRITNYLEI